MSITYTWTFNPLRVTYESASLQNIVTKVHWQVTAVEASGSWKSRNIGTQSIGSADSASFTAYDSLTHDQIFGWTTSSMGQERYDQIITRLSASIAESILVSENPTSGKMNPPWQI